MSYRNVVPFGYVTATLTLTGTSALLMNSADADPDSELASAFRVLKKKKGMSYEDEKRLRELQWRLALYIDDEIGPYIPETMIKGVLRSASAKWKRGTDITRSLVVIEKRIPLQYDGPRDVKALWEQGFRYTQKLPNAGMNRGRVDKTRPMFPNWKLEAKIAYDPEDIDEEFLQMAIERAQKYGIGDYRPTFGAFESKLGIDEVHREDTNVEPLKNMDHPEATKAHEKFKERIMRGKRAG